MLQIFVYAVHSYLDGLALLVVDAYANQYLETVGGCCEVAQLGARDVLELGVGWGLLVYVVLVVGGVDVGGILGDVLQHEGSDTLAGEPGVHADGDGSEIVVLPGS